MADLMDTAFGEWVFSKKMKNRNHLLEFWEGTPSKLEAKKVKKREEAPEYLYMRLKQ